MKTTPTVSDLKRFAFLFSGIVSDLMLWATDSPVWSDFDQREHVNVMMLPNLFIKVRDRVRVAGAHIARII